MISHGFATRGHIMKSYRLVLDAELGPFASQWNKITNLERNLHATLWRKTNDLFVDRKWSAILCFVSESTFNPVSFNE